MILNPFITVALNALVSDFSLPGDEKPLPTDQACLYLNEMSFHEEFEYGNLILILVSTRNVDNGLEKVKG